MRYWPLAILLVFCTASAQSEEREGFDSDPLHGLVVSATLNQVIGTFHSHGRPEIGDSLEIDLRAPPKEKLNLTPAEANRGPHYIPLAVPLKIQRVKYGAGSKATYTSIDLESADDTHGKFRVRIIASGREKGSAVHITLFYDGDFIGSMAEGVGKLK
jgi:hypothetical protein